MLGVLLLTVLGATCFGGPPRTLSGMVAEIPPPNATSEQQELATGIVPEPEVESSLLGWLLLAAVAGTSLVILRRTGWWRIQSRRTAHLEARDEFWLLLVIAGLLIFVANGLGAKSAIQILAVKPERDPIELQALVRLGGFVGVLIGAGMLPFVAPGVISRVTGDRHRAAVQVGVIAFLLILPLVLAINAVMRLVADLLSRLAGAVPTDRIMHETLDQMVADPYGPWWWMLVALIVIATPIYEELVFRGFIQTILLRRLHRPGVAIVVTSVLFALMHWTAVDPHGLVGLFALSLALGVVMERSGSITGPVVLHGLFNAGNIALAVLPG